MIISMLLILRCHHKSASGSDTIGITIGFAATLVWAVLKDPGDMRVHAMIQNSSLLQVSRSVSGVKPPDTRLYNLANGVEASRPMMQIAALLKKGD